MQQDGPEVYTQVDFYIVYCLYAVVSGIYMCFLSEHDDVKAFYNIIFFFIAVCLVGLVEELVFRGVVFNLLLRAFPKTKGGITGAVVLGGVLFGLMHFSNMGAGVKFSSCLIQVISAGLMGVLFLYDIRVYTQFLDACHFPYCCRYGRTFYHQEYLREEEY